jgi:hypothetical protein
VNSALGFSKHEEHRTSSPDFPVYDCGHRTEVETLAES